MDESMTLETGTRLGGYEVVTLLGCGGMDEVYRARDTRLDRDVAVKTFRHGPGVQVTAGARFEREARVLADQRRARDAAARTGDLADLAMPTFALGFIHLWRVELEDAERYLREAIAIGETIGDVVVQTRAAAYLTTSVRRAGLVERVDETAPGARALAERTGMADYVAQAEANRARAAWRRGQEADTTLLAESAMHRWSAMAARIPFLWTAGLALVSLYTRSDRIEEAIALARRLRDADQHRLPEAGDGHLCEAVAAWGHGDREAARGELVRGCEAAAEHAYL